MYKIIWFIQTRKNLLFFLVLELFCVVIIIQNNPFQGAAYFTSSSQVIGKINDLNNAFRDFFLLREVNTKLAQENAALRQEISFLKSAQINKPTYLTDSIFNTRYQYISALVIHATTGLMHNYITINKGSNNGIASGMGVICADGIVGKVKSVSENYSTLTSVLHKDMLVSCRLKSARATGTLRWEGLDASYARLFYIPRHIKVSVGDTVVTSEYNSIFPDGQLVGYISKVDIKGDDSFYQLMLKLSVDYYSLHHVYIIKNKLKSEQEQLEAKLARPKP